MTSGITEFKGYCWCGRTIPCLKHEGKPKPEIRKKMGKYSGYSKTFIINHGSEEIRDED